jgi:hypothetical protein
LALYGGIVDLYIRVAVFRAITFRDHAPMRGCAKSSAGNAL